MGNPATNSYEVLEIPESSSPQEIRRAYKALCMKWHPDKHPPSSQPEAEARFKAITQAYEEIQVQKSMFGFLSEAAGKGLSKNEGRSSSAETARRPSRSEELRRQQTTTASRRDFQESRNSNANGSFNSNNANGSFNSNNANGSFNPNNANGSFTYTGSGRRKPPPIERKLECTLEELCQGCKKEINFKRDVVTSDGLMVQQEESQTIRVKPGWKKGTKITFENMGDERPGCIPADIVYVIAEKKHPVFKRIGNDLMLKVECSLVNALTGWTFSFRLLNGEKMTCVFKDEVIFPGFEKVVQGQGMPLANEKGKKGDLRIKFDIAFPKQLTDEQRSALREILKKSS